MTGFPKGLPGVSNTSCGSKPTKEKKLSEIRDGLLKGRSSADYGYTISRGDAVKVLDNLANIISYRQARVSQ